MILLRYFAKEVYTTLIATTLVLLLIFISNQFILYLSRAAAGGIPVRTVMQLMSLQVPLLLGYLLPLSLFLGILLAYGRLYVDNEMLVLSACGLSKGRLLAITLTFSSLAVIFIAVLMVWVEPVLAWYRDHIFAEAAAASPLETVIPGRFQTIAGKWSVYIGDVSVDHSQLNDLFVAKMPDSPTAPWTIVSAAGGKEWRDPKSGDRFMVLKDGYRYAGIPGHKDFQVVKYGQYGVRIEEGKLHINKDAEFMSTKELWQKRKTDAQAAGELQWRFTMPISAFILAFMAVPLSRVRPRKGRYAKILPAMLIYIVYADLIFVADAAIEKNNLNSYGMWGIHGLMLLVALALMLYFVGWEQIKKFFRM